MHHMGDDRWENTDRRSRDMPDAGGCGPQDRGLLELDRDTQPHCQIGFIYLRTVDLVLLSFGLDPLTCASIVVLGCWVGV